MELPFVPPSIQRMPDGRYRKPRFNMAKLEQVASTIGLSEIGHSDNPFDRSYGLALWLLQRIFGSEWYDKYITSEPGKYFLDTPTKNYNDEVFTMARIRDLCELIINMLPNANAEVAIHALLTGDIQSGYGELKVGKVLRHYGIDYRYNHPKGNKREDFDLILKFLNNRKCAGEIKSIQEETEYNPSTIKNRILKAKNSNLPKGHPCIIFIHLPTKWFENKALPSDLENIKSEIFRSSGRLVNIFLFAERFHLNGDKFSAEVGCKEFLNDNGDFGPYWIWSIIHHAPGFVEDKSGWLDLYDICNRVPFRGTP